MNALALVPEFLARRLAPPLMTSTAAPPPKTRRLPPVPSLAPPNTTYHGGKPLPADLDETLTAVVQGMTQHTSPTEKKGLYFTTFRRTAPEGVGADWQRFVPEALAVAVDVARKYEAELREKQTKLGATRAKAIEKAKQIEDMNERAKLTDLKVMEWPTPDEAGRTWDALEALVATNVVGLRKKMEPMLGELDQALEAAAAELDAALDQAAAKLGVTSTRPATSDMAYAVRYKAALIRERLADVLKRRITSTEMPCGFVAALLSGYSLCEFFPTTTK